MTAYRLGVVADQGQHCENATAIVRLQRRKKSFRMRIPKEGDLGMEEVFWTCPPCYLWITRARVPIYTHT